MSHFQIFISDITDTIYIHESVFIYQRIIIKITKREVILYSTLWNKEVIIANTHTIAIICAWRTRLIVKRTCEAQSPIVSDYVYCECRLAPHFTNFHIVLTRINFRFGVSIHRMVYIKGNTNTEKKYRLNESISQI